MNEAIASSSDNVQFRFERGSLLLDLGRIQEALTDLDQVAATNIF
jgi:hypothetical protein